MVWTVPDPRTTAWAAPDVNTATKNPFVSLPLPSRGRSLASAVVPPFKSGDRSAKGHVCVAAGVALPQMTAMLLAGGCCGGVPAAARTHSAKATRSPRITFALIAT